MIAHPLALLAFLLATVAVSRWLEARVHFVKRISSAVVCTLAGILLASVGIIPHASPVFDAINTYAIPYAIVLVILASDLRELRTAGRPMVVGFVFAAVGSFVGGSIAGWLFNDWVGPETWKLSGQFASAFIGGGMNFVAVGRGLETEPQIFAAATVVDNLSTVPWMLAQVALYRWLRPFFRGSRGPVHEGAAARSREMGERVRDRWAHADMRIVDLAVLGGLPLAAMWGAELLAPLLPGFPQVLWVTTLAILFAQLRPLAQINGAAVLSYFALHLFFVIIGTGAVFSSVLASGLALTLFMTCIIAIHAVVTYGLGRLAGLDLETVTIASQTTVGGPGSALALAMSMEWHAQITPGIIMGIFGYAIGNYLGFACSYLTRTLVS